MKYLAPIGLMAVALAAFSSAGCAADSTAPDDSAAPTATGNGQDHAEHADHDHADHAASSDMDKMKAELAKMPPEDAAAAQQQHFCPVSGKMLGTMGAPLQVDVNGRAVWICCEGCREELLANPDKYLAKIQ